MAAKKSKDLASHYETRITNTESSRWKRIFEKFALAALGSVPWVGGFLSAAASLRSDEKDREADDLRTQWLKEHERRLHQLGESLVWISERLESLGAGVEERVQSEEFLQLVRQGFQSWDRATTDEKRKYIANLLTNSAGTRVTSDDVVRLFIEWIDKYNEVHFAVIREIHEHPGSSRRRIWQQVYGAFPREDSAEADLYKLLIRDLSTGGVIRQRREKTYDGQYLKRKAKSSRSRTMESAFEGSKPYVLTELGRQFVHYTMNEAITRIDSPET